MTRPKALQTLEQLLLERPEVHQVRILLLVAVAGNHLRVWNENVVG